MLAGDTAFHAKQRKLMGEALYRDKWHQQVKGFYEHITQKLLVEKSCKIAGLNQVDITREYVACCQICHFRHHANLLTALAIWLKFISRQMFSLCP